MKTRVASLIGRIVWRYRGLSIVLVFFAFFSMGHFAGAVQKEQELLKAGVVSAERYELRGADGRLGAVLAVEPSGEVNLRFTNKKGTSSLIAGLDANGSPEISFLEDKNGLRMKLASKTVTARRSSSCSTSAEDLQ